MSRIAKLLGGGFMLLFVPPSRQHAVKSALYPALHVPFRFQFSGSDIIFYDPERDYSPEALSAESALTSFQVRVNEAR